MRNLPETREDTSPVFLRIPRGPSCLHVMRVVMAGVASRHNLPLDALDDVELAVETLLAEEAADGGPLELEVDVAAGLYRVRLVGLCNASVSAALAGSAREECVGPTPLLDVRQVLCSLVDGFAVEEYPGPAFAVRLEKRIP